MLNTQDKPNLASSRHLMPITITVAGRVGRDETGRKPNKEKILESNSPRALDASIGMILLYERWITLL